MQQRLQRLSKFENVYSTNKKVLMYSAQRSNGNSNTRNLQHKSIRAQAPRQLTDFGIENSKVPPSGLDFEAAGQNGHESNSNTS